VATTLPFDGENGLDVAAWTVRHNNGKVETLILAVQMNYISPSGTVDFGLIGVEGKIKEVLFGSVSDNEGQVRFAMGRTSVAGAILEGAPDREEGVRLSETLGVQMPILAQEWEFSVGLRGSG